MLLANELAQWAVLLFLTVFVIGLVRQLGQYMLSPKEHAAIEEGPATGKKLPTDLLGPSDRAHFTELISSSNWPVGSVLVVREECSACTQLLEHISESPGSDRPPILVLSFGSTPIHEGLVQRAGDLSVEDEDRLVRAGFRSTPFVVLVDESLSVLHKEVTVDIDQAIANWRASEDGNEEVDLTVSKVGANGGG